MIITPATEPAVQHMEELLPGVDVRRSVRMLHENDFAALVLIALAAQLAERP